jgi:hypothetical protein
VLGKDHKVDSDPSAASVQWIAHARSRRYSHPRYVISPSCRDGRIRNARRMASGFRLIVSTTALDGRR